MDASSEDFWFVMPVHTRGPVAAGYLEQSLASLAVQTDPGWRLVLVLDTASEEAAELRRTVDGISEKMLASTLRTLEADGLVERTVYPEVPPRVEYALTARGDELMARMMPLMEWIAHNASEIVAR